MEGTRLTSVKNGICAVVAGLKDDDLINISCFSDRVIAVTDGFVQVNVARELLPGYLSALEVVGSTALYDATVDGIKRLREISEQHRQDQNEDYKYALLVLTDGEDTGSIRSNDCVLRYLAAPGISKFMVVLIAAEMERRQEQMFESWVSLRYCKQISVSVRSGKKLVQIFGEALMDRILNSDPAGSRFYTCSEEFDGYNEGIDPLANNENDNNDYSRGDRSPVHLSASLLRTVELHSPTISRAASETGSDYGDGSFGDFSDDEVTARWRANSSPLYTPGSPMYSPSSRPDPPTSSDFSVFESSYFNPTDYIPLRNFHAKYVANNQGERIVVDEIDNVNEVLSHEGTLNADEAPWPDEYQFITSFERRKRSFTSRSRSDSMSSQDVTTPSEESDDDSPPYEMICPISHEIMSDPVLCADGQTYERSSIERWIRMSQRSDADALVTSPLTGKTLNSTNLVPNHVLRSLIHSTLSRQKN